MDAKIVTLLLESGANPFCADKKGQSFFPNLSVSIPNLSVSVPDLSVSIPNLSVSTPNVSVSIPKLSCPLHLLLFWES